MTQDSYSSRIPQERYSGQKTQDSYSEKDHLRQFFRTDGPSYSGRITRSYSDGTPQALIAHGWPKTVIQDGSRHFIQDGTPKTLFQTDDPRQLFGSYCGRITQDSYSVRMTQDSYSGRITQDSYSGRTTQDRFSGRIASKDRRSTMPDTRHYKITVQQLMVLCLRPTRRIAYLLLGCQKSAFLPFTGGCYRNNESQVPASRALTAFWKSIAFTSRQAWASGESSKRYCATSTFDCLSFAHSDGGFVSRFWRRCLSTAAMSLSGVCVRLLSDTVVQARWNKP